MTTTLTIGRRHVEISHPDKLLFHAPDITKLELARYYEQVATAMLPHVRARPLALQAFPDGIEHPGFFLKSVPRHFPDWISTATVPKRGGTLTQVLADDAATLVYLAGQNVVTPHIWLSRADRPASARPPDHRSRPLPRRRVRRRPGRSARRRVIGCATPGWPVRDGHRLARHPRRLPAAAGPTFGDVHRFARSIAEAMVADSPDAADARVASRRPRGARIYLDVNRINYAQHAVAPYAVRPRPGAPVAMPIAWDELSDAQLAARPLDDRRRRRSPERRGRRLARDIATGASPPRGATVV